MGSPVRRNILCCIGTRPEAIKLAPVVEALQRSSWSRCRVLATAQHRSMLDQALEFFDIRPDIDLGVMQEEQVLPELTTRLLTRLDAALAEETPDLVLGQGDTTTVLATALACFYRRIPFGHVEAGLRTHDLRAPFPEEGNRVLAAHLSAIHFAPTAKARDNLVAEGIKPETIRVVGNPVIDALLVAAKRDVPLKIDLDPSKRMILVTAHRRENFGPPLRRICAAILSLCRRHGDVQVVWPVHPNGAVRPVIEASFRDSPQVHLCQPLDYGRFVTAMRRSYLVLTDSGGLQEEAPALGKPVLVMRTKTERPEAIRAGVARLVGTQTDVIFREATRLLRDRAAYASMTEGGSPYGDGKAAPRIAAAVRDYLEAGESPSQAPHPGTEPAPLGRKLFSIPRS